MLKVCLSKCSATNYHFQDNQLELIGAITLITDNGLRVLVDTGSASETEVLLRGLAENQVALDDIDVVVVTHGRFLSPIY